MNENQATVMFGAMSNNTRLGILRLLVERGTDGVTAGEIGTRVDASSSRASFHLSALENAGLCTSERRSRHIIYRANLQNLCGLGDIPAERLLWPKSTDIGLLPAGSR